MRSFCPCILLSHLSLRPPEEMLSVSSSSFLGACLLADISGNYTYIILLKFTFFYRTINIPPQIKMNHMELPSDCTFLYLSLLSNTFLTSCTNSSTLPQHQFRFIVSFLYLPFSLLSPSSFLLSHFSLPRVFEVFLCHVFSRTLRFR